jgi:hypothetical protein
MGLLKTVDATTIPNEIEAIAACIAAVIMVLKRYGIWTKIISKLKVHSAVAKLVNQQDKDTAIEKLKMPDDVISLLQSDDLMSVLKTFAADGTGKIVLEKAVQVLQDQGRFKTLLTLERDMSEAEKDEFIAIVTRVMNAYN